MSVRKTQREQKFNILNKEMINDKKLELKNKMIKKLQMKKKRDRIIRDIEIEQKISKKYENILIRVSDLDMSHECSICIEIIKKNIIKTPCSHFFCKKCIYEWVEKKNNCPNCRKTFFDQTSLFCHNINLPTF
jgi:hypothetical protein